MNKEFLIITFLSNTQSSSFQRGNVYAKSATDEQKRDFQKDFRKRLRALESRYTQSVSYKDHFKTIQVFANQLSQAHSKALVNGKLRIGTAQKAVNLFLKFLWSIDVIHEPPHCPVDRTILMAIKRPESWTKIMDIKKYKSIMDRIRQCAGQHTPAQWEEEEWNSKAEQWPA